MKVVRALGEVSGPLFVTTENESVMLDTPAKVTIHLGEDGPPLLELHAVVKRGQGADGGWYPAVVIRAKEVEDGQDKQTAVSNAGERLG